MFRHKKAVDWYNDGLAYFQLGKYDEAITCFNEASHIDPNNAELYNMCGQASYKKGKYDEASTYFSLAIYINPYIADFYNMRGRALYELGKYNEVIPDYNQAIKLDPNNADYYYMRGRAWSELSYYKYAINSFTQAITINPNNADYYYNRGLNYSARRKNKEANEDFTKAIELAPTPKKAVYYYERGNFWFIRGQFNYNESNERIFDERNYVKAIEDYTKAIDIVQDNMDYYFMRGRALYEIGKYDEAIQDYDKTIEHEPNNAFIRYCCGRARIQTGQYDKAIEDYNEVIRINDDESDVKKAYYWLGVIYYHQGKYKKALEILEKELEKHKDDAELWSTKGYILLARQDFQQAEDCFDKALKDKKLSWVSEKNDHYALQGKGLLAFYYFKNEQNAKDYFKQLSRYQYTLSRHDKQTLLYYRGKSLLAMQDDKQLARTCFDKAIKLGSSYLPPTLELEILDSPPPSFRDIHEISMYGTAILIIKRANEWLYKLSKHSLQSHINKAVKKSLEKMRQQMGNGDICNPLEFDLRIIKYITESIKTQLVDNSDNKSQREFAEYARELLVNYAEQLFLLSNEFPTSELEELRALMSDEFSVQEQLRNFSKELAKTSKLFQGVMDNGFTAEALNIIVNSIKTNKRYQFELDVNSIEIKAENIINNTCEQLKTVIEKCNNKKSQTFTQAESLIEPTRKEIEMFAVLVAKTNKKSEAYTTLWYVGMSALTLASNAISIAVAVAAANPLSIVLNCIKTCKDIGDIIQTRPLHKYEDKENVQELIEQLGVYIGQCFKQSDQNILNTLQVSHQQIMDALTELQFSFNMTNSKLDTITSKLNELLIHNFHELTTDALYHLHSPKGAYIKKAGRYFAHFYNWATEQNSLHDAMWPLAVHNLLLFICITPEFNLSDNFKFRKADFETLINEGKRLSKENPIITQQLEELRLFKEVYEVYSPNKQPVVLQRLNSQQVTEIQQEAKYYSEQPFKNTLFQAKNKIISSEEVKQRMNTEKMIHKEKDSREIAENIY